MTLGLVGEAHRQLMSNLFGTPPLAQQICDDTMELIVMCYTACPRPPGLPLERNSLRRCGQVAAPIVSVTAQLPRHSRGRPAHLLGDSAHTDSRAV